MFHVVTRFPILLALNTNANTVIDATRVKGARYICVVVTIEYSADNLRYKLRFVNGQMVHFTNFCLYESFGPESLFRISSFKPDYGNRMDFPCEKQISI